MSSLAAVSAVPAFADFAGDQRTVLLLGSLRDRYGFAQTDLNRVKSALKQAKSLPQLVQSEQNSKERTLTWDEYRPLHVNPGNISNGLRFMQEQSSWLARAQNEFGVPPAVVTALLGVETKYGTYTGRYRVLDALATLGYEHPLRSAFFFDQLTQFFVLCRDTRMDPAEPRGSYAGAMGQAQFMPSVYRRLALDFNGDGRRDLWSAPDAVGSIANYLVHFDPRTAWRSGGALLAGVRPQDAPPPALARNQVLPTQTVGALAAAGVHAVVPLPPDLPAGLVQLDRAGGPEYWIALPNFYSIMSYNPRTYYAMSVAQLADALERAQRDQAAAQRSARK
ncbi:MAG: lytic murein transglycosylase B [Nevskia sp.]|nr:lytic murein transglycosylase B [Nevskia sp.]